MVRIYLFNLFLRLPAHQQLWAVYERINKLTVTMQDIHAGKENQNQYTTVNNDNYITLTQPHTHLAYSGWKCHCLFNQNLYEQDPSGVKFLEIG